MKEGTKNSIAKATGLSVATCGNILNDLLVTGEIIELPLAESTGGRPSRQFKYNKDFAYIGCLYLSNASSDNSINYGVFNMAGELVHENNHHATNISLKLIDQIITLMINAYSEIRILSIGIPGVVKDGHILSCDFESMEKFDLCGYIEEKYQISAVVENDINATALGYYDIHGDEDIESLAYLYYPENVCPGSGFIINGQILRGFSNYAGEIGHLPTKTNHQVVCHPVISKENIPMYIAEAIASINCIINPGNVVVSYEAKEESLHGKVLMALYELVPNEHLPKLIFDEDIHSSYMRGLKLLAQESL